MTHNREVPEGYTLQPCEGMGLAFPMPDGWINWRDARGMQFLTKSRAVLGHRTSYETGMSIGMYPDMHRRPPYYSSLLVARHFIENMQDLEPTGDMQERTDGELTVFSRTYQYAAGTLLGLEIGNMAFQIAGISNEAKDTAYIATFETPLDQWDAYRDVAKVMIDGVRVFEA